MKRIAGMVALATLIAGGYYLLTREGDIRPRIVVPGLGDLADKLSSIPRPKLPPIDLVAAPVIGPGPALFWWMWRKRRKK